MAMKVTYSWFCGMLVHENRNGVERDYMPDTNGNTVALLDSNQQKTDTWEYWPHGEVISRTGNTDTPFQHGGIYGAYTDQAGKQEYVKRRQFRPPLGRWLTVDPNWPDQPPYAYCNNSPADTIDPDGSAPQKQAKQFDLGKMSKVDPCSCPREGPFSHTGYVYIDCNCVGKIIGILPEDGIFNIGPTCGKWIKADGVSLGDAWPWGGDQFLKIHGQTCLVIDCGFAGRPTPLSWCCYGMSKYGECDPTIIPDPCKLFGKNRFPFYGPPIVGKPKQ